MCQKYWNGLWLNLPCWLPYTHIINLFNYLFNFIQVEIEFTKIFMPMKFELHCFKAMLIFVSCIFFRLNPKSLPANTQLGVMIMETRSRGSLRGWERLTYLGDMITKMHTGCLIELFKNFSFHNVWEIVNSRWNLIIIAS